MYRRKAVDYNKTKWQGKALLVPSISVYIYVFICITFMVAIIGFIVGFSYDRRIDVNGEVATNPRSIIVYSPVQGIVVKRFVNEGALIKRGDPIYTIDISRSTSHGVVSDNQTKDVMQQLERIDNIIKELNINKKDTINLLNKQREQYSVALQQSTEIIRKAQEGVMIMKKNMDNYKHYQSMGLINKDQLTNQIALYYEQQNSMLSLTSQNQQNSLQIITIENEIQTQTSEFNNRINQMELQRFDLKKELVNIQASGEIIIRSLTDGYIDSMSVTLGQMINQGDSLIQIMPSHIKNYQLVLWVPNDAIPYIYNGERVNIRYNAFPSEKFGQFGGAISSISSIPASTQEMLTYKNSSVHSAPGETEEFYKVTVSPDQHSIQYNSRNILLENGMEAKVTLFLEKRKLYQWMFSPLYDMKHSASGAIHD